MKKWDSKGRRASAGIMQGVEKREFRYEIQIFRQSHRIRYFSDVVLFLMNSFTFKIIHFKSPCNKLKHSDAVQIQNIMFWIPIIEIFAVYLC